MVLWYTEYGIISPWFVVFSSITLYQVESIYAFLLAEILNFQGSTHRIDAGSFS